MPYDLNIEVDEDLAATGRFDVDALRALLERVLTEDGAEDGAGLSLVLAGDALLRELNLRHRHVDSATDVLSFPSAEGEETPPPMGEAAAAYLGDIVVSVETVERQAPTAGLTAPEELAHVVLHGALHLLGYDHEEPEDEARMHAREEAILGRRIHASRAAHEA